MTIPRRVAPRRSQSLDDALDEAFGISSRPIRAPSRSRSPTRARMGRKNASTTLATIKQGIATVIEALSIQEQPGDKPQHCELAQQASGKKSTVDILTSILAHIESF